MYLFCILNVAVFPPDGRPYSFYARGSTIGFGSSPNPKLVALGVVRRNAGFIPSIPITLALICDVHVDCPTSVERERGSTRAVLV